MRDTFVKDLKKYRNAGNNLAAIKKKSYKFSDQLKFLIPYVGKNTQATSYTKTVVKRNQAENFERAEMNRGTQERKETMGSPKIKRPCNKSECYAQETTVNSLSLIHI